MQTETLKDLLANATPGIRDVSKIGRVHIGGIMYPHVDQTRREGESWIDMRHRVQPELDKAEAECEANAKLESLAYELAAEVIRLREALHYADEYLTRLQTPGSEPLNSVNGSPTKADRKFWTAQVRNEAREIWAVVGNVLNNNQSVTEARAALTSKAEAE